MSICNGEISRGSSVSDLEKKRGVRFGSRDNMEDEIVSVRSTAMTEARPFGDNSSEMPFIFKSGKNKRKNISPTRIKTAVLYVVEVGKSIRASAERYKIDRKTLGRYVKKYKNSEDGNIQFKANHVSRQIFSDSEEFALNEYLQLASKLHYGLTTKLTTEFAYLYAIANGKSVPENWTRNNSASYEWLKGFMNRHKELALRRPESISLGRNSPFERTTVPEFFTNLRNILQEKKLEPEAIFNVDETDITVHKPGKIIAPKGEKQVSHATSGEHGKLVTMCCGISAIGTSLPPFLIFPREHVRNIMKRGGPPGMEVVAHPNGWMTRENFELYLLHFIKFSKCSKNKEVLVILDNHKSHITPRGLQLCKDNGITLLTLPPHTSHKLQPLDRTVFGPFKSLYNAAANDFVISHPGEPISMYEIPELIKEAFPRAFNPVNIQSGFACTGIWPINSEIFSESDFLGSIVTDRLNTNGSVPSSSADPVISTLGSNNNFQAIVVPPAPSSDLRKQLRPFPKLGPRNGRGGSVKSSVLTDFPVKLEI